MKNVLGSPKDGRVYMHPDQFEKEWKVSKKNGRYSVQFPVGLYQIVPVAWSVGDFINSNYLTYPNLNVEKEGAYASHRLLDQDEENPGLVEFRNTGTSVTVEADDEETAKGYAWRLLMAVIREKYRTLRYISKYENVLKEGRRITWQFYRRNDNDETVMILPLSPGKARRFLSLKAAAGITLETLTYELEAFTAVRAQTKDLAKQQALKVLRWLYKAPETVKPRKARKRTKHAR